MYEPNLIGLLFLGTRTGSTTRSTPPRWVQWSGTPAQHRRSNHRYRQMLIGAPHREHCIAIPGRSFPRSRLPPFVPGTFFPPPFEIFGLSCRGHSFGTRPSRISDGWETIVHRASTNPPTRNSCTHRPLPRRPEPDQDRSSTRSSSTFCQIRFDLLPAPYTTSRDAIYVL